MNTSTIEQNPSSFSTIRGIVFDGLTCTAAPVVILSCAHILSQPSTSLTANILGLAAIVGTGLLSISKAGDICSDIVNAASKNNEYKEHAVSNIGDFIARVQEKRGTKSTLKPRKPQV